MYVRVPVCNGMVPERNTNANATMVRCVTATENKCTMSTERELFIDCYYTPTPCHRVTGHYKP